MACQVEVASDFAQLCSEACSRYYFEGTKFQDVIGNEVHHLRLGTQFSHICQRGFPDALEIMKILGRRR